LYYDERKEYNIQFSGALWLKVTGRPSGIAPDFTNAIIFVVQYVCTAIQVLTA